MSTIGDGSVWYRFRLSETIRWQADYAACFFC